MEWHYQKKQEHELVKRYLSNQNSLKAFLKRQDLTWVNNVHEKLGEIVLELAQEAELERIESQEREAKRLSLIAMVEAEGWSVEALLGKEPAKKSGGRKADKYRFVDENGNEKGWSGFGAKPKALLALLEKGHRLDEFLIRTEDEHQE